MRHGRQAAVGAPHHGALTVADVGKHRVLAFAQDRRLARAHAAAPFPGAAGVRHHLELGREDRRAALLPFHRLRKHAGAERGLGHVGAVLAVAPAPAAGQPIVEHEDRLVRAARIVAAGQQVLEVEGAGDRPLRHDAGPDLVGRVHDLLEGHQEARHRHRPFGAHHRVGRRYDVNDAVKAGVQRQVGEEGLHAGDAAREGGAEGRVVDRPDRRVAAGEIVCHPVAGDRGLHADRDHALAAGQVAVDVVDRFPRAVGKRREALADGAFHVVLHRRHAGDHRVPAVLADKPQHLARRDVGGLRLGLHVADDGGRVARVRRDHVRDVAAEPPAVEDAHRRDADALAEHVLRRHVERARHRAAHVGPVAVGLRVADDLVADEDRPDQPRVAEMRAARIRVVDHVNVAGVHVLLEELDHRFARVMQRADVDRDVAIALRHAVAPGVVQRVGEVAVVDDEGIAGPQDLLGHLINRADEGVLQDLERHRVERGSVERGSVGHGQPS